MGQDDEVELRQIHALGFGVLGQDVRVIAGVKQDALAAVLDERSESPVFLQRRGLAKGVIQDGDLRLRWLCACGLRKRRRAVPGQQQSQRRNAEGEASLAFHVLPPGAEVSSWRQTSGA